ncbi:MAG: DHH family phosphoesterase [Ruminococcus sp.]|jgi:c-di-AMP phosphodiesterase-like protein
MNGKIKLSGPLKTYLNWPIALSVLLIIMNIGVYFINVKAGTLVSFCVAAYVVIVVILYFQNRPVLINELITFATQYGQIQKNLMKDFIIPYALLDEEGKVIWMNEAFSKITGKDKRFHRSVTSILSEVTKEVLPTAEDGEKELAISYATKSYNLRMQYIDISELVQNSQLLDENEKPSSGLVALYMFDVTELNEYIRKNEDEKLVSGLLYLDNYEEATDSVEEVRRSLLTALIERKINKYFSGIDGVVKKLEKDKYFLVMRRSSMDQLIDQKFSILEEIKNVNIGNEMSVTISIGLGAHAETFAQTAEYARAAIEMALGRGGDQAVIKDGDHISYYGGKSPMAEKTTRVKARVKAHALKEFISQKDNVVIMGHKITDVDTFGAAVGIYRAAKTLNKKAHIVINTPTSSIRPLMEEFLNNPDYDPHMFVNSHEARDLTGNNTVLVVVDTNRPSYTECEDLLNMTKTIVVLDHHRQGSEVIKTAVLSYIEPYASSACEMVAEILQYFADGIRIRNIEADSIYAGIMIDTNNFLTKTGVRTFEAAAFLRRCGADVTRVRKMFRENVEDYRARGEAIGNAQLFKDSYAISVCPSDGLESPTVVGAQAANELLNIVGVKASFVMTDYNDTIYVSARAIDEVNVQIIMERMGGGGHLNIAGAQLKNYSVSEAIDYLKQTLQEMIDEGAI